MADQAELDVLIRLQTTGQAQLTALQGQLDTLNVAAGGGFLPIGGGRVNFGGSLTKEEQAVAARQMEEFGAKTKIATAAERDLVNEGNNVARAMSAVGLQGAEAGGRLTALGGVMGSTGALGLGIGAAIIGLGLVYEGGKSIIDIAEAQQSAARNLGQAYGSLGEKVPTKEIKDFLETNRSFISSEPDVENAFATLARAGFTGAEGTRLMNDALDLSVVHQETVTQAAEELIKASEGNSRSLTDLGINLKDIKDPQKAVADGHKEVARATAEHSKAVQALNHWELAHQDRSKLTAADLDTERQLKLKVAHSTTDLKNANTDLAYAQALVKEHGDKFAALLDVLEPKIKKARGTLTPLQQDQNNLNSDWEELANDVGPHLVGALDDVVSSLDSIYRIGKAIKDSPNPFATWLEAGHDVLTQIGIIQAQTGKGVVGSLAGASAAPKGGGGVGSVNIHVHGTSNPHATAKATANLVSRMAKV